MKKPKYPFRSGKYDNWRADIEYKSLASKWYIHPELEERIIESAEDDLDEGESLPPYEEWGYEERVFTVQELMNLCQGLDPKNVYLKISRDRDISDITVSVIQEIPITNKKERKALYEADVKDWEARLAIYEQEMLEYDKWMLEEQIRKNQQKLDKLKGK
jgi:hypothetical protein